MVFSNSGGPGIQAAPREGNTWAVFRFEPMPPKTTNPTHGTKVLNELAKVEIEFESWNEVLAEVKALWLAS